eukprot:Awhi_evm1s809
MSLLPPRPISVAWQFLNQRIRRRAFIHGPFLVLQFADEFETLMTLLTMRHAMTCPSLKQKVLQFADEFGDIDDLTDHDGRPSLFFRVRNDDKYLHV